MKGDWPLDTKMPLVGGHEGAGVVVARGELVKDVGIGEHVGVKWINGSCLACDFCQQSDEPVSNIISRTGVNKNLTHRSSVQKHYSLDTPWTDHSSNIALQRQLMLLTFPRNAHWMPFPQYYAQESRYTKDSKNLEPNPVKQLLLSVQEVALVLSLSNMPKLWA